MTESDNKLLPEAIKKRLQIISSEFRKNSPRENYEGELFNYCVALLNRLELSDIQKQIYFNRMREKELSELESITKITTARIDKERLERRLGITQAFVDKCQKLADDGFDIVVCGKDFGSEPELSELPILTESEIETLRQATKKIYEQSELQQKIQDGKKIQAAAREENHRLMKQEKTFTIFNIPNGTIISYIKPAKPTESVNINTDINNVKIDNT
ncbi:MAG: hypothetical protein WC554_13620, partial [Clostridia bacterium]